MEKRPSILLIAVSLVFLGAGCFGEPLSSIERKEFPTVPTGTEPPPPPPVNPSNDGLTPPKAAAFGQARAFTIGDAFTYEDGVTVRLIAIRDEGCPPGTKCSGTRKPQAVVRISGHVTGPTEDDIVLTADPAETTYFVYRFTVKDLTDDKVTVTVERLYGD